MFAAEFEEQERVRLVRPRTRITAASFLVTVRTDLSGKVNIVSYQIKLAILYPL